eukprot:10688935-Lingulodinium_polyedra.AAC.1
MRPCIALYENVKQLSSQRHLKYIQQFANREGYLVIDRLVEASDYGSSTRRLRTFLLLVSVSQEPIDQLSASFQAPAWASEFNSLMDRLKIGRGNIPDFLLPETSPLLHEWMHKQQERAAKRTHTGLKKDTSADFKFESVHLEAYEKANLRWPPEFTDEDAR